ncbi:MAG: hypothetical protein EG825_12760 [Rhodocyclaceae bacterium]|nr:hypothetical protein [Rhodocyclaceae bacterium]
MSKNKPRKYNKNDGWESISYTLCDSPDENDKLSSLLNEACHVFHHHAEGIWDKDKIAYASSLIPFINQHPSLIKRLLATNDRVVKMITYKAIEMMK